MKIQHLSFHPIPPLVLMAMMTNYLFVELSHFGGSRCDGVKTPMGIQLGIECFEKSQ